VIGTPETIKQLREYMTRELTLQEIDEFLPPQSPDMDQEEKRPSRSCNDNNDGSDLKCPDNEVCDLDAKRCVSPAGRDVIEINGNQVIGTPETIKQLRQYMTRQNVQSLDKLLYQNKTDRQQFLNKIEEVFEQKQKDEKNTVEQLLNEMKEKIEKEKMELKRQQFNEVLKELEEKETKIKSKEQMIRDEDEKRIQSGEISEEEALKRRKIRKQENKELLQSELDRLEKKAKVQREKEVLNIVNEIVDQIEEKEDEVEIKINNELNNIMNEIVDSVEKQQVRDEIDEVSERYRRTHEKEREKRRQSMDGYINSLLEYDETKKDRVELLQDIDERKEEYQLPRSIIESRREEDVSGINFDILQSQQKRGSDHIEKMQQLSQQMLKNRKQPRGNLTEISQQEDLLKLTKEMKKARKDIAESLGLI
jgi:hypothetical protein